MRGLPVGFVLGAALGLSACSQQLYGQCDPPDDHLKVMFKPKVSTHPFSHSFCIVCNPDLVPSEYADWAMEMGAEEGPSDPNSVHPCLYAYSQSMSVDTIDQCESMICSGEADYNDMVGKGNGNFDLSPILTP